MKSVMKHQFSQVPKVQIQRSSFDRSHGFKTTFDAGKLIPIFLDEVLPGDDFNLRMTGFARLATPIHPIMDNMYMDTHFFFVPTRLVWDNWKKFNGEQDNPGDSIDYTIPEMVSSAAGYASGTLHDYLGLPIKVATAFNHNCLPHRCYHLIWNEWFRDENLQDAVIVDKDDGPDNQSQYQDVLPRGKRHDYFTSCLPWPQKGDSVSLPLGTQADIHTDAAGDSTIYYDTGATWRKQNAGGTFVNTSATTGLESEKLYADLSTATAATINQLRQAFQVQRLLEKDARGGTRYNELIKSHFGVTVPDFRVQRSEYLGGGSTSVNVNPVTQQSETLAGTPQGNLSGVGTAVLRNHSFTKSFTEHGYIIGLASVRADLTYQEGLDRIWSRETRYDFYQPTLANIGEQAVLSKEIFLDGSANDEDVFGYQERYAEYRYKNSKITGLFRSTATGSLDPWHLSQEFGTRPTLNDTFIEEDPPVDRVIAVPSQPHFLFDAYFRMRCARPMPVYSVPGQMDHF